MDGFEVFDRAWHVSRHTGPRVTIRPRGELYLNARACDAIGRPAGVILLYDRERRRVGIAPATGPDAHGTRMHRVTPQRGGSVLVSARRFAAYYQIADGSVRSFPARVENGMLVLDLAGGTRR